MTVTCLDSRYNITYPLKQGMVVSNEPGYYENGSFGIRIENLLTIKEVDTPHKFGGLSYFGFERLTFAPLQRKMLAFEVCVSNFPVVLATQTTNSWRIGCLMTIEMQLTSSRQDPKKSSVLRPQLSCRVVSVVMPLATLRRCLCILKQCIDPKQCSLN